MSPDCFLSEKQVLRTVNRPVAEEIDSREERPKFQRAKKLSGEARRRAGREMMGVRGEGREALSPSIRPFFEVASSRKFGIRPSALIFDFLQLPSGNYC